LVADGNETESGAPTSRKATDVDLHIGARLRQLRDDKGMTRAQLGAAVGKGFKQIRKYEEGENRIPASVLFLAAQHLETEVGAFYEGLDMPPAATDDEELAAALLLADAVPNDRSFKQAQELVRCYWAIESPEQRQIMLHLIQAVAENPIFGGLADPRLAD
jgi:transcriptional regulator with XRE-family HTH domain